MIAVCALVAMLLRGAAASAAMQDYPLELVVENRAGERHLVASNGGDVPVTLHLSEALGPGEEDAPGVTYVVEPRSRADLGEMTAEDEGLAYSFYAGRIDAPAPADTRCSPPSAGNAARYRLPFPDGRAFVVSQAYGVAAVSHDNEQNRYAVDFAMPQGVPVLASRGGIVADAELGYTEGGAEAAFLRRANRITIVHDDGSLARYVHLAPGAALVAPGMRVEAGTVIGYSGNTGYTGGPHLHFVVARPGIVEGKVRPLSIPFCFYVGSPPRAFAPVTGMLARAEYGPAARVAKPARAPRAGKPAPPRPRSAAPVR